MLCGIMQDKYLKLLSQKGQKSKNNVYSDYDYNNETSVNSY